MAKISEYLKIGEAAAHLGMHTDTLRRWDRAGKLEARSPPPPDHRLSPVSQERTRCFPVRHLGHQSGATVEEEQEENEKVCGIVLKPLVWLLSR